jgi:two-component system chemotaxis sensor kinase CheA
VDQAQREFLLEIEELVEHIFADLDELRICNPAGWARRELIDRVFRRVHSVKGLAASGGLEVVNHIAHEFENLLGQVRAGRVAIKDEVVEACESATEALSESLSLAASGIVQPSRHLLFDRLQAAAQNKTAANILPDNEAIRKNIPFQIWESLTEHEKQRLVSLVVAGAPLFLVAASFDLATFDAEFFRLKEKLTGFGEMISTSPAVDDYQPDKINFRVLYASDTDLKTVEGAIGDFPAAVVKQIANAGHAPGGSGTENISSPAPSSVSTLANFVRTDLDKLDRLISSTHKLLRTTSAALDLAMSQLPLPANLELYKLNAQIRNSFMGLEDQLINLRLVSLGPALQRAMRAGRAAARLAGKEIDFEISGAEIRLDKLLVEAIAGALIHLVRNAVDHGIETAAERVRLGKKERGTVRLEAISEGSQSRVKIMDDGRGVDPQLIADAAVRLGITSEAQLDLEQSLRLIFRPGFTSLSMPSAVSGRGVGLDVVETAVEQVGGELRVSSKLHLGSTFEILLPVTFGLVATNVVISAGHHYCIPTGQTLGIDAIDVIDGSSGANRLPQVSMRDLLGQPEESDDSTSQLHLVTCQFTDEPYGTSSQGSRFAGIVVDRVEGPQEVLVRSLGRHAGRWYGIAGATELKDGTVALVLDLPRLLSAPLGGLSE